MNTALVLAVTVLLLACHALPAPPSAPVLPPVDRPSPHATGLDTGP